MCPNCFSDLKLELVAFLIPFQVRNEKARRYLSSMRKKDPVPFSQKFPNADPLALKLLEKLLAFDPKDRPTAEEVILWTLVPSYLNFLLSQFIFLYGTKCMMLHATLHCNRNCL